MTLYRRPARLTAELVQAGHEQALTELLAEFNRQMDVTWKLLDLDRLDQTRADWLRHAVEVVSSHQEQAADIAAEFCQDWSRLFAGEGMTILRPGLQAKAVIREVETALDALGPAGVKARIRDGISPDAAMRDAAKAVKAAGELRVRDADRQTVMQSAAADPRATGWRRISHGGCKFCNMLAGRGEVYNADSVRFASHDHCKCTAAPAYGGQEVNVHQYTASKRKISEAQRRQLKAYLDGMEDDGVTPKGSGGGTGTGSGLLPSGDPDRFPDSSGRTTIVHAEASPPGRRDRQLTVAAIEERGLLAPENAPHRFLDSEVTADGSIKVSSEDLREHVIAEALEQRFGTQVRSVAVVGEANQNSPDCAHLPTRTTIEFKRNNSASPNAISRQITTGSRQSPTIVVDATVNPVSPEEAERAIRRALGTHGDRLDEVVILLPEGRTVRWARGYSAGT